MADIQAFRGLRYDLAKVGKLADVVAPPYDVIDNEAQSRLYDQSPHNIVRLILNRGDDLLDGQTIYERSAETLKTWRREGILKTDNEGALYVYHQTFLHDGEPVTRRGFIGRIRIEPLGEGNIFPHEQTHSKVKEDRFRLMTACQCNLSPIFSIYADPDNEVQTTLESAISDATPATAIDGDGVKHELWLVTNRDTIAAAASIIGDKALYIADGHHRYETACRFQATARQNEDLPANHPVDYVMMMCVSMDDAGMLVLPTHRLFRGVPPIGSNDFISQLGDCFDCTTIGKGPDFATEAWEMVAIEDQQSTMAFYCRQDDTWLLASLTNSGRQRMAELEADHSDAWRELGVSLLHRLVVDDLLGQADLPSPNYVRRLTDVVAGLKDGDHVGRDATGQKGTGEPFELAALVMPASLNDVKQISENAERMPAKSTYFYPKLLTGLVINPLE